MIKTPLISTFVFLLAFIPVYAGAAPSLPEDQTKAVILAYHRIGEDAYPDTNLRIDQFEEHIQEIQRGNYNVIALPELLHTLQNGRSLPPKTIVITFEGAYNSAYQNAMRLMLKENLPFTVFYAANNADQNRPGFLDWNTLKSLSKKPNTTLATLPASYSHIAHLPETELLSNLNKARQRHREELGKETNFLAYPFGEYSSRLQSLAKQQGFQAALGLHSGATHTGSDLFALPRFSMTENYSNLDRFRLVTNALPLPVTDIEPQNPDITAQDFSLGFTPPETLRDQNLSCFLSGHKKPTLERLGNRVEIRSTQSTSHQTRLRLNCTMPGPQNAQDMPQWRWFSRLFHRNPSQPENQSKERLD